MKESKRFSITKVVTKDNLIEKILFGFFALIVLCFLILTISLPGYMVYTELNNRYTYSEKCLENIAKDLCLKENLVFSNLDYIWDVSFYCNEKRKFKSEEFKFLKSELRRCEKCSEIFGIQSQMQ